MATEYDPKVDYYAILSIEATATAQDIKRAHRARIAEIHPDRGGDSARASVVNVARDVLSEPNTRREYDHARRDWILKSLQSPLMRAFFDPDGRFAASISAQARTQGSEVDEPPDVAAAASDAPTASVHRPAARQAQASPPTSRRTAAAGVSRLRATFAKPRARAASQAPANLRPDAHTEPSEPHTAENQGWRWGVVSERVWDDVRKVYASGDWLAALGLLGTALFIDRSLHESGDPAQRAKVDVAVAESQRERAMAFIETVAGAVGAHFGLDPAEVAARASAAAHKAASTTANKVAPSGQGKRRRKVAPRAGAVRTVAR